MRSAWITNFGMWSHTAQSIAATYPLPAQVKSRPLFEPFAVLIDNHLSVLLGEWTDDGRQNVEHDL